MSAYREYSGKSVEEALRAARDDFGVGLDELDFEILSPGSRGVLGMGAEPARIVAAPRSALGGTAPKREAAAATPLPPPVHDDRDRGPRRDDRDRGPRRDDRRDRPRHDDRGRTEDRPVRTDAGRPDRPPRADRPDRGDRGPRRDDRSRHAPAALTASETAEVVAARGSLAAERADLAAAEASPEALTTGKEILEELMRLIGFEVRVDIEAGETSRLNVVGDGESHESLGALIGRKGERLSALQHIVNLMLSRRMGEWTRVLVDVEDYRGRRERQLRDVAMRAAARVEETGKMLQLEPMPALERRWIHLALRDHPAVATQSIGEEPNRRIVVLLRQA
jgi:spoIIIJ-associated protein